VVRAKRSLQISQLLAEHCAKQMKQPLEVRIAASRTLHDRAI
jgi:hypothetical protein